MTNGKTMGIRFEKDSLGEMPVPADAYYGINTARAIENFPVSGRGPHPMMVTAYILIKKASAEVNMEAGFLKENIARTIKKVCVEIMNGNLREWFLVDPFQAGAGTSHNMNINEVIANRAIEILGGKKGDYSLVHPNDHVNMSQSSNDTFPTAMRLSILFELNKLVPTIEDLIRILENKSAEFSRVIKAGRTHLQDAAPLTLGMEFGCYASQLMTARDHIIRSSIDLLHLPMGGTAVGTGLNAPQGFGGNVARKLAKWTNLPFKELENKLEGLSSMSPFVSFSSSIKNLALELTKIANDLRLLSSGPNAGLGEIILPPVQAGSSIMPGKVNPVIAECLNMICFQIMGNDLAVSMASQAGQIDLNVMMPVIVHNILSSIDLLKNFLPVFSKRCIAGITANRERLSGYARSSPAIAAALNRKIGYTKAAEIAKKAEKEGKAVFDVVSETGIMKKSQAGRLLDPFVLAGLSGRKKKKSKRDL